MLQARDAIAIFDLHLFPSLLMPYVAISPLMPPFLLPFRYAAHERHDIFADTAAY